MGGVAGEGPVEIVLWALIPLGRVGGDMESAGAAGMTALILLQPGVPCTTCALPAEILLGLGMGAVFVLAFSTATTGVNQ